MYELQNILDTLKKYALNSDINYKHSACLLNKKHIISININKFINKNRTATIHAEINVINSIKNVKGLDILVIRYSKKSLGNSRPCKNCIDKMIKLGIRKVYYSNSEGKIVSELANTMVSTHISSGVRKTLKK